MKIGTMTKGSKCSKCGKDIGGKAGAETGMSPDTLDYCFDCFNPNTHVAAL